ncbi:discoidin domain-containing protein [Allomuricauda taeanensis]|uniref:discoidin domain-containing protein n=1 Tax=Flagellimonas taeanensis TaxID=1005926 RepID=UPI002E7AE30E|nr:discoidin domain-containing protein [Allomuricauda taeanensis]MEE1964338.1 discoidin domain-containing protein [Allomuricauda taeanensis]
MKRAKNINGILFLLIAVAFLGCEPDQVLYQTNQVFNDTRIKVNLKPSNWTIESFSSEEDSGEGDTGRAADVLDADLETYWHSCWTCDPPGQHPHELVINFGSEISIGGLQLAQRQTLSRAVKDIEVEISTDGSSWTSMGNFTLSKVAELQEVDFSENKTAKYVKIIIKSSHDGSIYAALAQVSGYAYE